MFTLSFTKRTSGPVHTWFLPATTNKRLRYHSAWIPIEKPCPSMRLNFSQTKRFGLEQKPRWFSLWKISSCPKILDSSGPREPLRASRQSPFYSRGESRATPRYRGYPRSPWVYLLPVISPLLRARSTYPRGPVPLGTCPLGDPAVFLALGADNPPTAGAVMSPHSPA